MSEAYKLVYATDDDAIAGTLLGVLKSNRIAVESRVNSSVSLFGISAGASIGSAPTGEFELYVPTEHYDSAADLIDSYLGNLPSLALPAGAMDATEQALDVFESDGNGHDPEPGDTTPPDDRALFARAILLGMLHMLGFGTIAALESASKISSSSPARRAAAFAVPIVWYVLLLAAFVFIGSNFSYAFSLLRGIGYASGLFAVNCIAFMVSRRVSRSTDERHGLHFAVLWFFGLAALLYFLSSLILFV